jgi:HAMP domain-containing protein
MKQCPNCKTTYADDSLQFCLSDGANLISVPDAAETVQMSFDNQPMRINVPADSAPTIYAQPPVSQNQPAKKGIGLIVAAILGVLLLLSIAGLAGAFLLFRQSDNQNSIVAASPTATNSPAKSPTATPNDETERLKEEMANLKKQLEDQKKQKSNFPATNVPPNQKGMTARANSPNDGFLALRSEPNSETGYRIAKIPHGASLTVLGCPKSSNIGKMPGRWCQVIYDGQSGWAFDAFMTF